MNRPVVYYVDEKGDNPVWDYIQALPAGDRNKCFEYIAYLEERKEDVRRPVGDYIGNKLYELRPKQTRIIYFFFFKKGIVLTHAFRKKANEIPIKEIRLAQARMNDFMQRAELGQIRLGE